MLKNKEINNELKDKELSRLLKNLLLFTIMSCIFGYIGYRFCVDNDYDVKRGIIFGALFPMGIAFMKKYDFDGFFSYIVYIIVYSILLEFVPTWVGIALLFIIISIFIIWFIRILINVKPNNENTKNTTSDSNLIRPQRVNKGYNGINKIYETEEYSVETYDDEIPEEYEEYFCERCDKKISEEEYEDNCGLCEDCYAEVYFGERYDGDDYDLYR